ncbi:MAG: sporulation protein YabP [Defluviitaleaceae bacterium]|nr:sporulation protein YabP [Defluviitaleaceae bacterium]
MPEEKKFKSTSRHAINLVRRESMTATGVLDVISFDEESIIAETELGMMIIRGINLHVNRLNLENGELAIDGEISGVTYEDSGGYVKGKASLLGKLFR